MIQITNIETFGWETAIRGMRNPMNSWAKSDSIFDGGKWLLGAGDHRLMLQLAKAGSDHAKFRRMINVTMDILAPLYWWKEFDTYKVGTVANSTSTMHKIHAKEFTLDDFSHEHLDVYSQKLLKQIIVALNTYRNLYINYDPNDYDIKGCPSKKTYWWQMIQLLPSSYNQLRTVQFNYEVLANIYKSRKDHKLDEWREFCSMIERLPYSEIITLKSKE